MAGIANVQSLNDFFPPEILWEVFKQSDFSDHSNKAQVCKIWNAAMQSYLESPVAYKQLIDQYQSKTKQRAAGFLNMVPLKLEDYCEAYTAKVKFLETNYRNCTGDKHLLVKGLNIYKNSYTQHVTVYFSGFYKVCLNSPNIPEALKADLVGKVFVKLYSLNTKRTAISDKPWASLWSLEANTKARSPAKIQFFPIELFRVKIVNDEVVEKQNNDVVCIVFNSSIIQIQINYQLTKLGYFRNDGDKVKTILLQPNNSSQFYNRAKDFYIPRLHALPQST